MILGLQYVGANGDERAQKIGYGRLGVNLARQLRADGVTIFDNLPEPYEAPDHWNRGTSVGIANVVCWASTPGHAKGWYKGQTPTLFTMWEATVLPELFRETMDAFDTICVPSLQNVDLFSRWHRNVKYVPLGIDPAVWTYMPRKAPVHQFRFLVAGSGERKGGDVARAAFRKAFPNTYDPEPILVIKTPRGDEYGGPGIELVSGYMSAEAEVDLYAGAHCYLGPSRGEGFGLQPLQALAQGIPTILTGAHGHESFMNLGLPVGYTMTKAGRFMDGDAGEWWEPNVDDLVDRMRYVYENYTQACRQARSSATVVANAWTWKHTADTFLDALGRDRLTDCPVPGEWTEPERKKYLVVTDRDHQADICGYDHTWKKGQRYYESADTKRILFDAEVLDPICFDADPGLSTEQFAEMGDYSARHSWCPTCHQKLGSGITQADQIYADIS